MLQEQEAQKLCPGDLRKKRVPFAWQKSRMLGFKAVIAKPDMLGKSWRNHRKGKGKDKSKCHISDQWQEPASPPKISQSVLFSGMTNYPSPDLLWTASLQMLPNSVWVEWRQVCLVWVSLGFVQVFCREVVFSFCLGFSRAQGFGVKECTNNKPGSSGKCLGHMQS